MTQKMGAGQMFYDRFYENLVEATLKARVESGQVYQFQKTKPGRKLDEYGVDFIIHFSTDSTPLDLQVKGSKRRGNRKRADGSFVKRDTHEKKEAYRLKGIKLLLLKRDATELVVWARLWYLSNVPNAWRYPSKGSEINRVWACTENALFRLHRNGVIESYEPHQSLDSWLIVAADGRRMIYKSMDIGHIQEQMMAIQKFLEQQSETA